MACHSNDLAAASALGMRTAHVARPNEHGPGKGETAPSVPVDFAVKNLGDERYKTDGQEFSSVGNIQTVYYGDPRTWNLTIGARF